MKVAIEAKGLSVEAGGQTILQGLDLAIPAGTITGLLGPSGAGKTTLMRSIVGRQSLSGGSLHVFGKPAGTPELRSRIGYMTQSSSVYPDLTVLENLRYFAVLSDATAARVQEVLKEVDLTVQAKQLVSTLSGGQCSRVSLAIALLAKPELLILDEPTVGLDPLLRRSLWQQFRGLAEQGTTLLVSSHVLDEAAHCDQLVLIHNGKLLLQTTPDKLYARTGTTDMEGAFVKLMEQAS